MRAVQSPSATIVHDPDDLICLFNATFAERENTVLLRGGEEPLYLPADGGDPRNRILFAHGFFASALHEVAHWCIAGRRRRRLVDYGYWYQPDGRDAAEQAAFEAVEARPQALEWAFSIACGKTFRVSVDNLDGAPVDRRRFSRRVHAALRRYAEDGFPSRAQRFLDALSGFYGCDFRLPPQP
ncbi:elongation factor P hydroxylase [Ectothiorhodospiraceae bacterium WFHF3C12]|nr:elongation factor P hydroxylase [Ectothiorhodospiraceae bacterium WFHF3C12]